MAFSSVNACRKTRTAPSHAGMAQLTECSLIPTPAACALSKWYYKKEEGGGGGGERARAREREREKQRDGEMMMSVG
jgi:hypothetical protein